MPQKRKKQSQVSQLQADAVAAGRRWIRISCRKCPTEVLIHVDWVDPLVLCKSCRVARKVTIRAAHAKQNAGNAMRVKMPKSGVSVPGGSPGSGRRR